MPPKKKEAAKKAAGSPADTSAPRHGSDHDLKDKELKELKHGGAKGRAQKPLSKSAVASASKKRTKKAGSPLAQHVLSALALVTAVGVTYYLTSKPPPVNPVQAAPVGQDGTDQSWVRDECQSWADDGECDNNPALMKERCPGKCKGKKTKPAKAKKGGEAVGPPDKSEHCGVWAAAGECEKNAAFMLGECAASCRGGASKSTSRDLNQDCTPWVKDGECYRNPAFMLQQCKASCEEFASDNEGILQARLPSHAPTHLPTRAPTYLPARPPTYPLDPFCTGHIGHVRQLCAARRLRHRPAEGDDHLPRLVPHPAHMYQPHRDGPLRQGAPHIDTACMHAACARRMHAACTPHARRTHAARTPHARRMHAACTPQLTSSARRRCAARR